MLVVVLGTLPAQQTTSPTVLTLSQAVEDALKTYPSIRVSKEQINAAAAGDSTRTDCLPAACGHAGTGESCDQE